MNVIVLTCVLFFSGNHFKVNGLEAKWRSNRRPLPLLHDIFAHIKSTRIIKYASVLSLYFFPLCSVFDTVQERCLEFGPDIMPIVNLIIRWNSRV